MFRAPAVIGLTLLAGVVRFATLDAQSFWYDEALTHELVNDSFFGMLGGVFEHEAQPPPYFVLVWLWTKVAGDGEVGLRSLSALLGTLTVPIVYEAARLVAGRRAALAAAALTALSPVLVWYSQEARSYALVVFASALAVLFFLRSLDRPPGRDLALWAAASVLAVGSHYFALFLVLPMAAWLFVHTPDRRRLTPYIVGFGSGLLVIAPMLIYQGTQTGVDWIGAIPRWPRVRDAVFTLAAGPTGGWRLADHRGAVFFATLVFATLAIAAALAWSPPAVRRRVALVLGLGATVILIPLAAAFVGADFVLDRNFLPAWVPLAIVVATGLCVARLGWAGPAVVVALCVAFAGVVVAAVPRNDARQRDDWRAVAELIGPATEDRVISVSPYWHAKTLAIYQPGMRRMRRPRPVREVVTVELETFVPFGQPVTTIAPRPPFRQTLFQRLQHFTVVRYTAPAPVLIDPATLRGKGRNRAQPYLTPPR